MIRGDVMRKLIVSNMMSLDGYCAGLGKDTSVLPMDEAFDDYNAERLGAADTFLLGRITYDMFRGFWPDVANDASATPTNRNISRLMNAMDKLVISDSMDSEQTEPWRNTQIIRRADAHQQLAKLKRQSGKDIFVGGSRTLWNDLLAHNLVDELHLMIGPVMLGGGTPIFDGQPTVSLQLIDMRKWDGSENVLVRYEVRRKP
jgi:dihydrofolate reductase